MNFGLFNFVRVAAIVLVAFFIVAIEIVGVGVHEWRGKASLERLGTVLSDGKQYSIDFWVCPPQLRLTGKYHGVPFHYEKVNRKYSHLLVDCVPGLSWEASIYRHHPWPAGISRARLDQSFPHWISLYASPKEVPWTKRSLDRRPLGFGSAPGIDLYREAPAIDNLRLMESDLNGLIGFCSQP